MLPPRIYAQHLSQRIKLRPARYVRMTLVSLLLIIIVYHSLTYSGDEESNSDVPDVGETPLHPQKLRLRVRAKPGTMGNRAASLTVVQPPNPISQEQRESISSPLRIAIMTAHYFGSDYARSIQNCSLHGVPLSCSYVPQSSEPHFEDLEAETTAADAVWWHAPNTCLLPSGPWPRSGNETFSVFKARAQQWSVIASMESSAYYSCLDDESFMANFDIRMTYHRTAEVPLLYWSNRYRESWEQHPPLPLSEKKDAVAFVNSNCEAPSGRNQIVASLRAQPGVKVDALGRCLSGGGAILNGPEAKHEAFRGYRYCIAMENSIAKDYVTEKIYDAFAAGCVPIYLGAPNIHEFIPSMDAIIDYNAFGTPEALAQELRRLSSNRTAYLEKFDWQKRPETWGKEFLGILATSKADTHTQCQLCQVIARDRAGIPYSATKKTLRRTSTDVSTNGSWTQYPKFHVKNIKIEYQLAAERKVDASGLF